MSTPVLDEGEVLLDVESSRIGWLARRGGVSHRGMLALVGGAGDAWNRKPVAPGVCSLMARAQGRAGIDGRLKEDVHPELCAGCFL